MKKQPCDPLFMVLHEAHISFGQPKNERDRQRDGEREREIKRGKRSRGGGVCAFALPTLSPVSIFVSFFCAGSTHTLTVQWIFNLALISCVPDETNTDSLFTFVKAPAAAVLVPHTPCVHTKHALTHTPPLNSRPNPSWGLQEEQTLHKMALATLRRTLPSSPNTRIYKHTHSVCHVSLDRTLPHISTCHHSYYTASTPQPQSRKAATK